MPHRRPDDLVTYGFLRRVLRQRDASKFYCWIFFFALLVFFILTIITISVFKTDGNKHHKHVTNEDTGSSLDEETHFCTFRLPPNPTWITEDTVYLGRRYDWKSNRKVEGYAYLTYHRDIQFPSQTKRSHSGGSCTNPFATGARWKETESFVIDPANDQGLSDDFFFDMNWQAMCELDSKLHFNLFGTRDNHSVADGPDTNAPDGKNEIQFGIIEEPGVIAVAIVWGIFDGPIPDREIVEFDIEYSLAFQWGNASIESGVIDGENIAVHELCHGIGFGHVSQSQATMFPSASLDETKKRTLLACEIEGICIQYGEAQTCPGHNSTGTIPPRFNGYALLLRNSWILTMSMSILIFFSATRSL